jgi:hypothetical protein
MEQHVVKEPTSEEVERRNALSYVLLQVNDIFRSEVRKSDFEMSSLKTYVSFTPNFGHKDFTEGMKEVFHDWYEKFDFLIEFTIYKDSIFLRSVCKPIHQSSGKKDIHFSDVKDAANGVRTFLKGIVREWKKESQKRSKEKKNSWVGSSIESELNEIGCISNWPGKILVSKIKGDGVPFNSIEFESLISATSDRASLKLSISVDDITPDKLERILKAIKGM